MAANFRNLRSREEVEFLGGTQTRNVIAVSAQSLPSGIYFEFRVPRASFLPSAVDAGALSYATVYELIASHPYVVGVEWGQRPTPAGELQDTVTVTVESSSGESTQSFTVPWDKIGPDTLGGRVAALHDVLDATEAL